MMENSADCAGAPALTVKKSALSKAALFLFMLAPAFAPAELVSALMLMVVAVVFVLSGFKAHRGMLALAAPILLLMAVGVAASYQSAPYDIFKDVWYTLNPLLALAIGYLLMHGIKDLRSLFKIIVFAASVASVLHVSYFIFDPGLIFQPADSIRAVAGRGYFITVLAVCVLAACRKAGMKLMPGPIAAFLFLLCFSSIILSFSRTLWTSLAIMIIVVLGFLTARNLKKLAVLAVAAAGLFVYVFITPESQLAGPGQTLRGKMAHSFKEVMVSDYRKMADISVNWRGYESFLAIQTYLDGDSVQHAIGRGFGTLVDLGIYMDLGGEKLRYIPIFHNGYIFVLVKTGVLGLLLYIYFLARVLLSGKRAVNSPSQEEKLAGRLLIAIGLVLSATTFVIAGFFNKSTLIPAVLLLCALASFCRSAGAQPERPSA